MVMRRGKFAKEVLKVLSLKFEDAKSWNWRDPIKLISYADKNPILIDTPFHIDFWDLFILDNDINYFISSPKIDIYN